MLGNFLLSMSRHEAVWLQYHMAGIPHVLELTVGLGRLDGKNQWLRDCVGQCLSNPLQ